MTKKGQKETEVAGPMQMAAKDVNAVLKPKPLIDLTIGEEALEAELKDLLSSINKGDDLAATTWATLKKLGWEEEKIAQAEKLPAPPATPKVDKPAAKKTDEKPLLKRKDALYSFIREKGKTKIGFTTESLMEGSTAMMVKANGNAGVNAWNICQNTIDALVEFGVLKREDNGTCRLA